MAQAVIRRLLTAEACVLWLVSMCGVCGKQSDAGTGFRRGLWFPLSASLHHCIVIIVHISLTQYNLSN